MKLLRILLIFAFAGVGCSNAPSEIAIVADEEPLRIGDKHDAANAATINGHVYWRGPILTVATMQAIGPGADGKWRSRQVNNPYAPIVNEKTKAVHGAVVFLESVVPQRSRPWDHAPVRLIGDDDSLMVEQGEGGPCRVGFVRRGDEVEVMSRNDEFESIAARGAAFFTLPFPRPGSPLRRCLNKPGIVEWSSGAGRFWLRANLFVVEHPYYCRTDSEGRFELPKVPPGDYRLVAWLPNPTVLSKDRDPNMGHVIRQHHASPIERYQWIEVLPRQRHAVDLHIGPIE